MEYWRSQNWPQLSKFLEKPSWLSVSLLLDQALLCCLTTSPFPGIWPFGWHSSVETQCPSCGSEMPFRFFFCLSIPSSHSFDFFQPILLSEISSIFSHSFLQFISSDLFYFFFFSLKRPDVPFFSDSLIFPFLSLSLCPLSNLAFFWFFS